MLLQQQEHYVPNINPVETEFAIAQFSMLRQHYVYLHLNNNLFNKGTF